MIKQGISKITTNFVSRLMSLNHVDIVESLEESYFRTSDNGIVFVALLDHLCDESLTEAEMTSFMYIKLQDIFADIVELSNDVGYEPVIQISNSRRSSYYQFEDQVSGASGLKVENEKYTYQVNQYLNESIHISIRFRSKRGDQVKLNTIQDLIKRSDILSIVSVYERSRYLADLQWRLAPNKERKAEYCNIQKRYLFEDGFGVSARNTLKVDDVSANVYYLSPTFNSVDISPVSDFVVALGEPDIDLVWTYSEFSPLPSLFMKGLLGWFENKSAEKYNDIKAVHDDVSNRNPIGNLSVKLIVYKNEDDGTLDNIVKRLSRSIIGVQFLPECSIVKHSYITSILGNCSADDNRTIERYKPITLEWALHMAPVWGSNHSYRSGVLTQSRYGLPFVLDRTSGSDNKMTVIFADSGSGKSVELQDMQIEFLDRYPNGHIYVIDQKTSQIGLVGELSGKLKVMSESNLSRGVLSAFAIDDVDDTDIDSLRSLVMTALSLSNNDIVFNSIHSEVIQEALVLAYKKSAIYSSQSGKKIYPNWKMIKELLPQVKNHLVSHSMDEKVVDSAISDISTYSICLGDTGQFKDIFSTSQCVDDVDSNYVVYDLDGITDEKTEKIAYMSAFMRIVSQMKKLDKLVPKMVVFDEFGILVGNSGSSSDEINKFINNVIKTYRKVNAQGVAVANAVEDFTESEAGKTFWGKSTLKLFLGVGSMLEDMKLSFGKRLTELDYEIISSLSKEKRFRRSSVYMIDSREKNRIKKSTYYTYLSPYREKIVSTDPMGLRGSDEK